jgi:hypothetical protein
MDPVILNVFFAESFNEAEGETVPYSLLYISRFVFTLYEHLAN